MNKLAPILVAWLADRRPAGPCRGTGWMPALPGNRSTNRTQHLLAGQKERWESLPPERQRAMADGAERWLSMNDTDRAQARERWKKWRDPAARGTRADAQALEAVP